MLGEATSSQRSREVSDQDAFRRKAEAKDDWKKHVKSQARRALWRNFAVQIEAAAREDPMIYQMVHNLVQDIAEGKRAPRAGAREIVDVLLNSWNERAG